ncbi:large ribosomal subunit protein uL13m-like [Asterias amurensis]|uniref:large ribosomal subunit protein uL13m-like n=1 Tax=Asterias amurensis TaxID=7602 RepID=UPI003AB8D359
MSSKISQQWAVFARMWYLLDAYKQPPGRLALRMLPILQGAHKPVYHPLSDLGDHVVVINTRHIALSGDKWRTKIYKHHTGYPGGYSETPAFRMHEKDPTVIVKKAIYGMLPKDLRRRHIMQRLHLFADDEIPDDIRVNICEQIKPPRVVPKSLPEYSEEERAAFPRLWYSTDSQSDR